MANTSDGLPELTLRTSPGLLKPPSRFPRDIQDADGHRRSSQDSILSGNFLHSPGNSDTYVASQSSEPRSPDGWGPSSKSSEMPNERAHHPSSSEAAITNHDVQIEYASHDHQRFWEAQREWMAAAFRLHPDIRSKLVDGETVLRLEDAWSVIEELSPRMLNINGSQGQTELLVHSQFDGPPASQTLPFIEEPEAHGQAVHVSESAQRYSDGPVEEDFAELYYKHLSAARYRSDDLINLGPRPGEDHAPVGYGDQNLGGSRVPSPNPSASFEYADRHLKLIAEIEFHEAEATRYKALCVKHDIKLDEDSEEDFDIEYEDMYQSLLQEVKHPGPRLDSMLTLNENRSQLHVGSAMRSLGSAQNLRIQDWQDEVESHHGRSDARYGLNLGSEQTPAILVSGLTEEPLPMGPNGENRVGKGGRPSRQHYRSKSTSALLRSNTPSLACGQQVWTPLALCPRLDSGCSFD